MYVGTPFADAFFDRSLAWTRSNEAIVCVLAASLPDRNSWVFVKRVLMTPSSCHKQNSPHLYEIYLLVNLIP